MPENEKVRKNTVFNGKLKKLQLKSYEFFRPFDENTESEQHLTLTADGRVWISRYFAGNQGKRKSLSKEIFKISVESAGFIFSVFEDIFNKTENGNDADDTGFWELSLTNTEGEIFVYIGALIRNCVKNAEKLSDIVRTELNKDELWVLDGNPEKITKISIDYHKQQKFEMKSIPAEDNYIHWNYSENLTIDRKTEAIEFNRNVGRECTISHKYCIEGGIEYLLDDIEPDIFDYVEEVNENVIENPLLKTYYVIKVYTNHHELHEIKGRFDKEGLPVNYTPFIKKLMDFLFFFGAGDLISPSYFARPVRHKGDLVFCQVIFEEDGKKYCYLADEDIFRKGEFVIVPVGKENEEKIARIKEIIYAPENEAPYPVEKIKHIISKYDNPDFTEL